MSTLEARIAKLETRQGITAERTAFQLDDATLERIIVAFLIVDPMVKTKVAGI